MEHVACTEEMTNTYRILVLSSERIRPRGRPSYRWQISIKIDLSDIVWDGMG